MEFSLMGVKTLMHRSLDNLHDDKIKLLLEIVLFNFSCHWSTT